jgi:phenylpyruvate tautomerase PptA (4-oxalocrotonate tautomerase family)
MDSYPFWGSSEKPREGHPPREDRWKEWTRSLDERRYATRLHKYTHNVLYKELPFKTQVVIKQHKMLLDMISVRRNQLPTTSYAETLPLRYYLSTIKFYTFPFSVNNNGKLTPKHVSLATTTVELILEFLGSNKVNGFVYVEQIQHYHWHKQKEEKLKQAKNKLFRHYKDNNLYIHWAEP